MKHYTVVYFSYQPRKEQFSNNNESSRKALVDFSLACSAELSESNSEELSPDIKFGGRCCRALYSSRRHFFKAENIFKNYPQSGSISITINRVSQNNLDNLLILHKIRLLAQIY